MNFHSIPSKLLFELASIDPAIRTSLLSITATPYFIYFVTSGFGGGGGSMHVHATASASSNLF